MTCCCAFITLCAIQTINDVSRQSLPSKVNKKITLADARDAHARGPALPRLNVTQHSPRLRRCHCWIVEKKQYTFQPNGVNLTCSQPCRRPHGFRSRFKPCHSILHALHLNSPTPPHPCSPKLQLATSERAYASARPIKLNPAAPPRMVRRGSLPARGCLG